MLLFLHCQLKDTFHIVAYDVLYMYSNVRMLVLQLDHNLICDITETLLTEVCQDVQVRPDLQEETLEELKNKTANTELGARLDITCS